MRVADWKSIKNVTTGLVMTRDCDSENGASIPRSDNHKRLYSSFFSNVFAGGSQFMRQLLLKCLSWRLLNQIAVYCPFPAAQDFSNHSVFHTML